MLWNPPRDLFIIPGIDHPIRVYGALFALSFLLGYFAMIRLFLYCLSVHTPSTSPTSPTPPLSPSEQSTRASYLADRLCWYVVLSTVIGARLGHVFFYQWTYYQKHLLEIVQVWKGGLASHGGTIAVVIALALYTRFVLSRFLPITFLRLLDLVAIPTSFVACCIRIGNFFNQEIVGTPTTLPWGVIFGDPLDGPRGIPLHPAQLYEAAGYFATFVLLVYMWKQWKLRLPEGSYVGVLFFLVFTCRIAVETVKSPYVDGMHASGLMHELGLSTGQLLSFPFVAIGALLLLRAAYMCRFRKEGTT